MSLISSVHLGNWEYYVFSDNTAIWRATNGLAAWFNSSGGMIQGAAWLGALLLLATILFGAAVRKQVTTTGTIGAWFFFMTTMGITGQAVIHNVYTGQVTVVNNVPALALVPASVFSKAAYSVFLSMDTAFQGTSGSYMSVSQYGFIGPLEVLLALRSPKVSLLKPELMQNLVQATRDCGLNPLATPTTSLMATHDALNWLIQNGRDAGITKKFTADNLYEGETISCTEAKTNLTTEFNNFIDGTGSGLNISAVVNAETTRKNPSDPNGLWSANSVTQAHSMVVAMTNNLVQTSQQFTTNALAASSITYTLECMYSNGLMTNLNNCQTSGFVTANQIEKMVTSGAMAGSGFLKTMFTSMGMLQSLFFALFPIIAIYGLVLPNQTGKVFGGYIFFGVWCQSWMLMVAPIQSYIQTSIVEEMSKILSGSGGMTPGNMDSLYTALATKIGIAGDLMASAQMLSLALLSGSMYALSGLAQKWSGAQDVDSSMLQKDAMKNGALTNVEPGAVVSGMSSPNGYTQTRVANGTKPFEMDSTITSSNTDATGVAATDGYSTVSGTQINDGKRTSDGSNYANQRSVVHSSIKSRMISLGVAEKDAQSIADTATELMQKTGNINSSIVKALSGPIGAVIAKNRRGRALDAAENDQLKAAINNQIEATTTEMAAANPGFINTVMGGQGTAAQINAVADLAEGVGAAINVASIFGGPFVKGGGLVVGVAGTGAANVMRSMAKGADKLSDGAQRVSNAAHYVGSFAQGLAGGAQAMIQATSQDKYDQVKNSEKSATITDTNSQTGQRTNTSGQSWTDTKSREDFSQNVQSWSENFSKEFKQSTESKFSKGEGSTVKMQINPEILKGKILNGHNGIKGQDLITRGNSVDTYLRNSGLFSKDEIALNDAKANQIMQTLGDTLESRITSGYFQPMQVNGESISPQEQNKFIKDVVFENLLTKGRNDYILGNKNTDLAPQPSSLSHTFTPEQRAMQDKLGAGSGINPQDLDNNHAKGSPTRLAPVTDSSTEAERIAAQGQYRKDAGKTNLTPTSGQAKAITDTGNELTSDVKTLINTALALNVTGNVVGDFAGGFGVPSNQGGTPGKTPGKTPPASVVRLPETDSQKFYRENYVVKNSQDKPPK